MKSESVLKSHEYSFQRMIRFCDCTIITVGKGREFDFNTLLIDEITFLIRVRIALIMLNSKSFLFI